MEPNAFVQAKIRSRSLPIVARLALELAPHEILLLLFSIFISIIAVFASSRVLLWPQVLLYSLSINVTIIGVNIWESFNRSEDIARWLTRLRLVYLFPVVLLCFQSIGLITHPIHPHDFDAVLITADRMIFGVNPTYWLFEHFSTSPWLTEYLMISYASFYFLPLALTIELYFRSQKKGDALHRSFRFSGIRDGESIAPVEQVIFIIIFGFLLSYIAYLFLPSIGPRFMLHNFFDLGKDLPGMWLTKPLRMLLDRGENVLPGMSMDQILRVVNRDAFPSGHTDITCLTIFLAFYFRSRLRWFIAIIGVSLIFSTVYLRYHYVIDVIGGFVLAAITLYAWQWVRKQMLWIRGKFA